MSPPTDGESPTGVASTATLPPPKGLFAHIRENNFRSLALFAWFVVLLETLYVATSVILISLGSPVEIMLRGTTGDRPARSLISNSLHRSTDPLAEMGVTIPNTILEVWTRFWERDALLGSIGLAILLLAALYVLVGLWLNTALTRRQANAIRVDRRDEPRLYGLVEPMAIARGLPMPKLEVVPSAALNAYASGMSPATSVIGVTQGLMMSLTDAELEAVLAHEFAHIENRDNRLMTIANLCAGVVTKNSRKTVEYIRDKPIESAIGFGAAFYFAAWQSLFIGYGAIVLAYFVADSVKHLISRKREFIADARAIEMVKDPAALMTALHKIAENDKIDGMDPQLQAMMISNVAGTDQWTHPSIAARIAAISATTNVLLEDALAQAPRKNRNFGVGQPRPFGTRSPKRPVQPSVVGASAGERPWGATQRDTFGKRSELASSSAKRKERHIARSYGANEQWTTEELRSQDILDRVQTANARVSHSAKSIGQNCEVILRWLWALPFVLVLLTFLPTVISLPAVIGFTWIGWSKFNRQKRMARVLNQ
ncbi:MAG: M48 family metalloprotease [Hyphomicrobiaceae bacterium]